jgi:SAM-dependent methyltransferase
MDYDAELRLLNQALRLAYGIERHDRVLDVGCGTGQTTREAARMAVEGSVLGIDLSAVAIDRARELAGAKGIRNVTFLRADAQAYPFPSERFDLVVSRFGTMFFRDPVAAFANVGRALRRAGRLAMMVWQGHEQNEWSVVIEDALGGSGDSPASEAPDPFSLAEPAKVDGILDAAGFTAVTFSDVQRPSSSVRTSGPRSSGSVASRLRKRRLRGWAPHRRTERSGACERPSGRTPPGTASGSTRGPGS